MREFLRQLFVIFFDGTLSELYWFGRRDAPRLDRLTHREDSGFIELKRITFRSRNVNQYADIVNNAAEWENLDRNNMSHYFDDPIDMFPFTSASALKSAAISRSGSTQRRELDSEETRPVFLGIAKPDEFFRIQRRIIERRFPGGAEGDIGDQDLRDQIAGLRHVFRRNFAHLAMQRRIYALTDVLLLCLIYPIMWGVWIFGPRNLQSDAEFQFLGATAITIFSSAGAYLAIILQYRWLQDQFKNAITTSCDIVGRNAQSRLDEIISIIPQLFSRVDWKKFELKNIRDWPIEVKKWSRLAFWMDARVENIEIFMQIQMWRLRRIHYGLRIIAVWWSIMLWLALTLVILTLACASLILNYVIFRDDFGLNSYKTISICAISFTLLSFSALISWLSFQVNIPDLDLIEQTLATKELKGHKDCKLHDLVAEFMFREKSALLREEDKVGGGG